MNAGRAITAGMRAQRNRDLVRMRFDHRLSEAQRSWLTAWCWWGWNISGNGGLGYPGADYPRRFS